MCGGICGPTGEDYNSSVGSVCHVCWRDLRMCNCMKPRGGLKKRANKNRKLTKPLRKEKKNRRRV